MRIAICEDSFTHAEVLKTKVTRWANSKNVQISIEVFESAEEFLVKWPEKRLFDLVFIDIQMKFIDGMELAELIRKNDANMMIVFVTGFLDYVMNGYDVHALKYIVKPIQDTDCWKVMDRAYSLYHRRKDDFLIVPLEMQSTRIPLDDIYYFEIRSHYVNVNTKMAVITYKERLKDLEARLPSPHFFKCHRSYIVNIAHVRLIDLSQVYMDNDIVLPVARARWVNLNNAFLEYYA